MRPLVVTLLVVLTVCDTKPQHDRVDAAAGAVTSTSSRTTSCLQSPGDSVVFSDVIEAEVTGDLSGFEFTLVRTVEGWSGFSREATGEFGGVGALVSLMLDTLDHRVEFALPSAVDTAYFRGHLSCDSLWGLFTAYPSRPPRAKVYPRVK